MRYKYERIKHSSNTYYTPLYLDLSIFVQHKCAHIQSHLIFTHLLLLQALFFFIQLVSHKGFQPWTFSLGKVPSCLHTHTPAWTCSCTLTHVVQFKRYLLKQVPREIVQAYRRLYPLSKRAVNLSWETK